MLCVTFIGNRLIFSCLVVLKLKVSFPVLLPFSLSQSQVANLTRTETLVETFKQTYLGLEQMGQILTLEPIFSVEYNSMKQDFQYVLYPRDN